MSVQESRISDLDDARQRLDLSSRCGRRVKIDNPEINRCSGSLESLNSETSSSNVADHSEAVGLYDSDDALNASEQRERVGYLNERDSNQSSGCSDLQD